MSFLFDYQTDAINRMKNGCILCGGVGSGKSRTAIGYYFLKNGGKLDDFRPMKKNQDLYIITTARKRDSLEWEGDLTPYLLSKDKNVFIDSWNNIQKYKDVYGAFFIFDEQRVVGSGAWVKAFLNITRKNEWILLSATPGDSWSDYIPVFVANGFYKNKSDFIRQHVVYNHRCSFPKIDRYVDTNKLIRHRNDILVDMDFNRKTVSHNITIRVDYDAVSYKDIFKRRWNIYTDEPVVNAAELCYTLRKCVNNDDSRQAAILELLEKHPRMIIFYNFDYELDILKSLSYGNNVKTAEWNGHKHEPTPKTKSWVYFVQYTAGAEGWNCITTDTIVFFSQNYSYKIMTQAKGRIDRLNTPFKELYYYHLKSSAPIDIAISRTLANKRNFNERKFCDRH